MAFTFKKDSNFVQKRTEFVQKRLEQDQNGGRDFIFKQKFSIFTPKDGDNFVRFLPATWPDAIQYGYDVWCHYQIGVSKSTFLCINKMKGEACPICEAKDKANHDGDAEYAQTLAPQRRVLAFIIDRNAEDAGPLLWNMPYTKVAKIFISLSCNKRTGAVTIIEDPESGRDVYFTKQGKAKNTKYEGLKIEEDTSSLAQDGARARKWLEFVAQNPIPSFLEYKSADHIRKTLLGDVEESAPNIDKPIVSETSAKTEKKLDVVVDTAPTTNGAGPLTVEKIQAMSKDALISLIAEKNLDLDPAIFDTNDELASAVLVTMNMLSE